VIKKRSLMIKRKEGDTKSVPIVGNLRNKFGSIKKSVKKLRIKSILRGSRDEGKKTCSKGGPKDASTKGKTGGGGGEQATSP